MYNGREDFEERFNKKRKLIKNVMITIATLTFLAVGAQLYFVYWGIKQVDENGGLQKTLTDIVRVVKQIDKDSDNPKE